MTLLNRSFPILLQGQCPGLSHGQRYGITYVASLDTAPQDVSTGEREPTVVKNHYTVEVSEQNDDASLSKTNNDDIERTQEAQKDTD